MQTSAQHNPSALAIALVLCTASPLHASPLEHCEIGPITPAADATDVPTNAVVDLPVRCTSLPTPELIQVTATGPDGETPILGRIVAIDNRTLRWIPNASLQPNARCDLEIAFADGAAGYFNLDPDQTTLSHSFTTGDRDELDDSGMHIAQLELDVWPWRRIETDPLIRGTDLSWSAQLALNTTRAFPKNTHVRWHVSLGGNAITVAEHWEQISSDLPVQSTMNTGFTALADTVPDNAEHCVQAEVTLGGGRIFETEPLCASLASATVHSERIEFRQCPSIPCGCDPCAFDDPPATPPPTETCAALPASLPLRLPWGLGAWIAFGGVGLWAASRRERGG